MPRTRNSSKRHSRKKAVPALGIAVFGDGQWSISIDCWIGSGCAGTQQHNPS
jgi:hypothetical protein